MPLWAIYFNARVLGWGFELLYTVIDVHLVEGKKFKSMRD